MSEPASTVAMLHTVAALPATFTRLLAERGPAVRVFHLVDESLLADTIAAGMLPRTRRREAAYAGFAAAVDGGSRIGVLATLESTLAPTTRLIERTAAAGLGAAPWPAGRQPVLSGRRRPRHRHDHREPDAAGAFWGQWTRANGWNAGWTGDRTRLHARRRASRNGAETAKM